MAQIARITTFSDGNVLTAAQLNDEFDNVVDGVNTLDDANISSSANINPVKISASIAGDGLAKDPIDGSLDVQVDDTTVEIASNLISIKDDGIDADKIATDAVTTAKIINGAVTRPKLAALGQQQSGYVGETITSSSYVDVPGLSITITTTGKPVMVALKGLSTSPGVILNQGPNATTSESRISFLRDATQIAEYVAKLTITIGGPYTMDTFGIPASAYWTIDTPAAGTYTYKVQAKNSTTGASSNVVVDAELIVWELG
jgi:hypothetical protein